MFLGNNTIVWDEDVVCILPRETTQLSRDARRALYDAIGGGRVDESAGTGIESYVLCQRGGKHGVYASPIASVSLIRRNRRGLNGEGR